MLSFTDLTLDIIEEIAQVLEPRDLANFQILSRKCYTAACRVRIAVEGIEYIEQANWAQSIMVKINGGHLAGYPTTEFDYMSASNSTRISRKKHVDGECFEDVLIFEKPTSLMEVAMRYLWEILGIYRPKNLTLWLVTSEFDYPMLSKVLEGSRLAVCDNLKIRGRNAKVISDLLPFISAGSIEIATSELFYCVDDASASAEDPCLPSRNFLRRSNKSVVISGCALRDAEVALIRSQFMEVEICTLSAKTVESWIKDFYADRSDRLMECSIRWASDKQVAAINKKYERVRKVFTEDDGDVLMVFVFTLKEDVSQRLVISRIQTDANDTYGINWEPLLRGIGDDTGRSA